MGSNLGEVTIETYRIQTSQCSLERCVQSKESLEAEHLEEAGRPDLRRCHLSLVLKEKLQLEDGGGRMCGRVQAEETGFKGTSVCLGCILYGWSTGVSSVFCLFVYCYCCSRWVLVTDGRRGRNQIMEGPFAMPRGERAPRGSDCVCHGSFPQWVLNTRVLIMLYSFLAFLILLKDSYL